MDPTYPVFTIFAFLFFLAILIPLPAHLQAKNVGTCSYIIWTALALLNQFVNSIVWRNNALNPSFGWCDFSSHLIVALSVAIPASSLAIVHRLYTISRIDRVSESKRERMISILIELGICVGIPLISVILYWFVQGHRYNVFEEIGCMPVVVNTALSYILLWMWPLVLAFISVIYGSISTYRLLKSRREAFSVQAKTPFSRRTFGGMSAGQFVRLLALAMVDTFFTIPLSIVAIVLNTIQSPVVPWTGLDDVHFGFSRVEQIAAVYWRLSSVTTASFICDRVFTLLCALIFIAFFSFSAETRKWWSEHVLVPIVKRLGLSYGQQRGNDGYSMNKLQSNLMVSVDVSVKRDTMGFGSKRKPTSDDSSSFFSAEGNLGSFWLDDEDKPKKDGKKTTDLDDLPRLPRISISEASAHTADMV